MLQSPGSLKLMGKGFILGDFLGIIPFTWNPGLERPEFNLSRKRIAGAFTAFAVTVISLILLTTRVVGEVEGRHYYITLCAIFVCLLSSAMQVCTALSGKELPRMFTEIQFFAKSFTSE